MVVLVAVVVAVFAVLAMVGGRVDRFLSMILNERLLQWQLRRRWLRRWDCCRQGLTDCNWL